MFIDFGCWHPCISIGINIITACSLFMIKHLLSFGRDQTAAHWWFVIEIIVLHFKQSVFSASTNFDIECVHFMSIEWYLILLKANSNFLNRIKFMSNSAEWCDLIKLFHTCCELVHFHWSIIERVANYIENFTHQLPNKADQ